MKTSDVLAFAAAIGEQLVNRGHFGERADLGNRDVHPAVGDQVKDPAQAGGGAVRRGGPQAADAEAADGEIAADQPSGRR